MEKILTAILHRGPDVAGSIPVVGLNKLEVNDMTFMNSLNEQINSEKQLTENGVYVNRKFGQPLIEN